MELHELDSVQSIMKLKVIFIMPKSVNQCCDLDHTPLLLNTGEWPMRGDKLIVRNKRCEECNQVIFAEELGFKRFATRLRTEPADCFRKKECFHIIWRESRTPDVPSLASRQFEINVN